MKKNIIQTLSFLLILLLGIYLGSIINNKKNISSIYIDQTKKPENVNINDFFSGPLFSLLGKDYYFKDLPIETQKNVAKLVIASNYAISEHLKTIIAQSFMTKSEKGPVEIDKLPDLVTFYKGMISNDEIEKIYEKNIEKFSKGHNKAVVMSEISVKLLTSRVVDETKKMLELLKEKKSYFLYNQNPTLPEEWFDGEGVPLLGNSQNPEIKVDILMSYVCKNCSNISKEIGELIKAYDLSKISVRLFPLYTNAFNLEYYINKSALCLYKQDQQLFWKYNIELLDKSPQLSLINSRDINKAISIIKEILKKDGYENIKPKELFSCIESDDSKNDGKKSELLSAETLKTIDKLKVFHSFSLPLVFINGKNMINYVSIKEAIEIGLNKKWTQIK